MKQKQQPLPVPLEKTEEGWADRAAEMMGYKVKRLSQRRRSKVALGLPDRLYLHPIRRVAVWAELKSDTGKPSAAQREFHDLLRASGQLVVCGTANVVGDFLVTQLKAASQ